MTTKTEGLIRVGPVTEVARRGCSVVTGAGHAIAVFYHSGKLYAVDNRCPHMGFPLSQGSVRDGILTCHWHHARFDLTGGGTFDPFADDVRSFPVLIINGEAWVDPTPPERDEVEQWSSRLRDGMEHDIRLVIAKSVLGLQAASAGYTAALRIGALFGLNYAAEGWTQAMSILTCTANILPQLAEEDRARALYQGLSHVADECAGKPPRFAVDPLPLAQRDPAVLKLWFRNFIDVRDAEGAERALRTAIELGLPPRTIADMVFAAATDHIYLNAGHTVDFANKAFELLDHIGWEDAALVLTALVNGMASARRSQELNTWRHPIDIAGLVTEARQQLPALLEEGRRATRKDGDWKGENEKALADLILGDNPGAAITALKDAIRSGATPAEVGSAVACAAFLRMARYHTSNEFSDWDTVHNTLTTANALHQALKRAPSPELLRSVFDTAMSIYLDRFLNMPPQRLPETDAEPVSDPEALLVELLDSMNTQQQVEPAAHIMSRCITGGVAPEAVLATLGHAMLREDAGFHEFQIVDAGMRQFTERRGTESGRHVLIAVARFLAAHSPTVRSADQTYRIALRLHRGEDIYNDEA